MRELEDKHRTKKILYSIPVLLLLMAVVAVFARGTWRAFEKDRNTARTVGELSRQVEALKDRESELELGIARLQTEEGVKEELKTKFNVAQEGEQFALLIDEREEKEATSTEEEGLVRKWWNNLKSLWP